MINFSQVGNDLYTGKRSVDFIKRQKTWYALSAVLIALALVGIFVKGLNFGIEFSGGSEFRVQGVSNSQGYEEKAQSAISTAGIPGNVNLPNVNVPNVNAPTRPVRRSPSSSVSTRTRSVPRSSGPAGGSRSASRRSGASSSSSSS